tara:strand:+ start:2135 stop:2665 length:531 start_codon:yes stop_codon:yes gene_type:complete
MKRTIIEEVQEFKRLMGEATSTASSGAYEQPLGFNQSQPTTICPHTGQPLMGSEIGTQAPSVDVVDVTVGIVPMNEPTSYDGDMNTNPQQPGFDDMPYLSSHPSDWSFEGDEDEFLTNQGWQRPQAQGNGVEVNMAGGEDEEAMSAAFDELDDDVDDDVFNSLQMFTETKNGLGWK